MNIMPNSDDALRIECLQATTQIFFKEPKLIVKLYEDGCDF